MRHLRSALALAAAACIHCTAGAGVDHRLNFDQSGIWARSNQRLVDDLSTAIVVGGALYEGNDTRLGRTFWKAGEAMVVADFASEALKRATRRARPIQGNDPGDWFGPRDHRSFPSSEVTHITAIVTPFIAEYGRDRPLVWALAALPLYVGASRMKEQAHWQTDVLAGAALGAAMGYYESRRDTAWSATVVPRGLAIGFRRSF